MYQRYFQKFGGFFPVKGGDNMKRDPDKDPKIIDPAPEAANADVGTAADVDAIMRKFDRESNTRVW